jgi:hypothetical protein
MRSDAQVFTTVPSDHSPTNGPALTISAAIPDLHHYIGRGGRAVSLWRDAAAFSEAAALGRTVLWHYPRKRKPPANQRTNTRTCSAQFGSDESDESDRSDRSDRSDLSDPSDGLPAHHER